MWLAASDREELSFGGRAVSQVGLWVGLAGAAVVAARWKGSGRLSDDFGLRLHGFGDVGVGIAFGIFCQVVLMRLVALVLWPVLGRPDVEGPVEEMIERASDARVVGLVLLVVVGAPLVEELFFRGLLLRSLQRRLGTAWAVGLSGALFGLAHPPGEDLEAAAAALVMISLAVLGVALAMLTVRLGRLGPAIIAHAIFNASTLAWLAWT